MSYIRHEVTVGGTANTGANASVPYCLPVPCRPGVSGWVLVGFGALGLMLNVIKFVKPTAWGTKP